MDTESSIDLQASQIEGEDIIYQTTVERGFLKFFRKKYYLAITDVRVMLLRKSWKLGRNKAKRVIDIKNLKGITKSTLEQTTKSLVLHIKEEYDEYLHTSDLVDIIETLK